MQLLQAQNYPGNVRELRNLLERSALMCDGNTLEASHVAQALQSGRRSAQTTAELSKSNLILPKPVARPGTMKSAALAALKDIAQVHIGSRAELAAQLGISERSLYRQLKALTPK
jgi:DNA-binding NtrC family response regulator